MRNSSLSSAMAKAIGDSISSSWRVWIARTTVVVSPLLSCREAPVRSTAYSPGSTNTSEPSGAVKWTARLSATFRRSCFEVLAQAARVSATAMQKAKRRM